MLNKAHYERRRGQNAEVALAISENWEPIFCEAAEACIRVAQRRAQFDGLKTGSGERLESAREIGANHPLTGYV